MKLYDVSSSTWKEYTYDLGTTNILDKGLEQADLTGDYHSDVDARDDDGVEIWPLLYEKALTELNGGANGNVATTWTALTGQNAEKKPVPTGMGAAWIRDEIDAALSAGKIVGVGTHDEIDASIVTYYNTKYSSKYFYPAENHAYLIDGITGAGGTSGTLALKNPWGKNHIDLEYQHYGSVIESIYILDPL